MSYIRGDKCGVRDSRSQSNGKPDRDALTHWGQENGDQFANDLYNAFFNHNFRILIQNLADICPQGLTDYMPALRQTIALTDDDPAQWKCIHMHWWVKSVLGFDFINQIPAPISHIKDDRDFSPIGDKNCLKL